MPFLPLIHRFSVRKNKKENKQQKIIFNKIITKNQNTAKNKELEILNEKEENLIIKNEEKDKEDAEINVNNLTLISSKLDDVFVTFCLHIHLHEGLGLEVHDTCGSSDPYIKCQYGGKTIYKSEIIFRELNPKWNEKFSFLIQDPTEIITFKVFDFDRFMRDDFMGTANVSLNTLKLSEKTQFKLKLEDPKMQEINIRPLGYLIVSMTLTPINEEQKELFIERSIRGIVSERKGKQEIQKDEEQTTSENENIIKNNNCYSFIEEFNGNIESQLYKKYNFWSSFQSFEDVGFLIFKIFEAEGLAALDVNGKSDPFCVLELCNFRLQTHTEYKTLCPKWNCFFKFPIKDVHQIIELTVYDEDPNKRVEFLGKIAIPLLNIFNGEKRWYMLKDKKLDGPAKGRILVEGILYFNYFKAALKTFQPKEIKLKQPLERFKRQKFLSNANRLRSIADLILDWTKFINYCLSWKSYPISICSLMFYIIFVSLIQLWHFPFILLIILIYNFINKYLINLLLNFERKRKLLPLLIGNWVNIATINKQKISIDNSLNSMLLETQQISLENDKLDEDNIKIQNEIKKRDGIDEQQQIIISKSLRERLQAIQETLTLLQQQGDFLVGLIDRIKGILNFTVPFLSLLAIFSLLLITILLYYIPIRLIIIIWGINKFSKKLLNPNYVDTNELLDFLSRVPIEKEIINFRNSSSLVFNNKRKIPRHSSFELK